MFQGTRASKTNPDFWTALKPRVRELRRDATPAEQRLWSALRGKRVGVKFRRQHPLSRYVVDFYCVEAALAIEVDGSVHETRGEADATRQAYLEENKVKFLRFTNEDVLNRLPSVIESIQRTL
jgi:very-short-patch-repair endonuclease